MNSIVHRLIEALQYIEQASFQEALLILDKLLQENKKNFWAWLLGAVSLAFLNKMVSFEYYLEQAQQLAPNSSYVHMLHAYIYMQQDQKEKAIMVWTKILDTPQEWFAKKLLDSVKSKDTLKVAAKKNEISRFIILPDLQKEIERFHKNNTPSAQNITQKEANSSSSNRIQLLKKNMTRRLQLSCEILFRKSLIIPYVLIVILLVTFIIFQYYELPVTSNHVKNFVLHPNISLAPKNSLNSVLHTFSSKKEIVHDFNQAKHFLWKNKINQARYLLKRIIYSNADWSTKEQCKSFLKFIPFVNYDKFHDPIHLSKLLEHPELYVDSQLLLSGKLFAFSEMNTGKQLQALVNSESKNYIIDAYIPNQTVESNWKPYHDFDPKHVNKDNSNKKVVFFGRFKGLIGQQNRIYLELDNLWL